MTFTMFWDALLSLLAVPFALLFTVALIFFWDVLVTVLLLGYALWGFAKWITPILGRGISWLLPRLLEAGQLLLSHWAQALAVLALVHAVATLHRTRKASTLHP